MKKSNSAPIFETQCAWNENQIKYSKKIIQRTNNKLLQKLDLPKDDKHKNEEQSFIRYFDITHIAMNNDVNIRNIWFENEQKYNFIQLYITSLMHDLDKDLELNSK